MNHPNPTPRVTAVPINRRRCLGLLSGLLPATTLPGCALVNTESPYWATVAAAGGVTHKSPVSRAQSDALPYASILSWFEDSPIAFMVLGEVTQGGTLYYYSQSRQVLGLRGPFVVQTVGMPGDLSRTAWAGSQPPDLRELVGKEWLRRVDIQSAALYEIPLRSRFSSEGRATITILDRTYEVEVIREDVEMKGEKPYTNRYWVDPNTGYCWKSRQHIHARALPLNIEVTKPAG